LRYPHPITLEKSKKLTSAEPKSYIRNYRKCHFGNIDILLAQGRDMDRVFKREGARIAPRFGFAF